MPLTDYEYIISSLTAHYGREEAVAMADWIAQEPDNTYDVHNVVKRLLNDEPLQYIFEHTNWLGLRLHVTPDVLIPRPETADLIFAVERMAKRQTITVLDIGTGSGCIAIALKKRNPAWHVYACDISENALRIAQQNAIDNSTDIQFFQCDILRTYGTLSQILSSASNRPLYIVSNPPYVCESEKATMPANVLYHEPVSALFVPDNDPLLFYRHIAQLLPNVTLCLETNERFGKETAEMLRQEGYADISIHKDIFGKDRIVTAVTTSR